MYETLVLVTSIGLQLIAAFLALRLIRVTKRRPAWMLIAIAIFFMALRRSITLFHLLSEHPSYAPDHLSAEMLALITSLLMVFGIAWIAPLFLSIRNSEEALKRSEEHFRLLYQQSPLPYQSLDESGCFAEVNPAWLKLFGYDREEVIGHSFGEFLTPKYKHLFTERFSEFKKAGESHATGLELICKDGRVIDVEVERKIGCKADGSFRQTHCILYDVTERKKAAEELQKERYFTESIVNTAQTIILVLDKEGRIIRFNPYMEKLTGYKLEEVKGKDWFTTFLPECDYDKIRKLFNKAIGNTQTKSNINAILTKDKKEILVEWHDDTLKDNNGNIIGLVASGIDITERKKVEKKLYEYQERLKSLASELASSEERERRRIAVYLHDHISQSLALERIGIEGLRKSVDSVDKKVIEELSGRIKTIIKSVQSLTFDLSSPTLYKFGLEKAVDELLDDIFGKTEINYKLSHDTLPIKLDNNLSVLLFRGIRELLVNIIKHARAHKVRVDIRRDGGNIQITVSDDGSGLDVDQNELLVSRTGGFGLFNIQERISFIGGSFDIQSQPGKGCRLTLIAPIKKEMELSKGKSDAGYDFNG